MSHLQMPSSALLHDDIRFAYALRNQTIHEASISRTRDSEVRHLGVLTKFPLTEKTLSTCNVPSLFPDWQLGGEDGGSTTGDQRTRIRTGETSMRGGHWMASFEMRLRRRGEVEVTFRGLQLRTELGGGGEGMQGY